MRQWRLIYGSPVAGQLNMALDDTLLSEKLQQPVLRLYAWSPPCLSLGVGQRIRVVDMQRLKMADYDIVRRPTGGRAILHADELTYSLVLPAQHPLARLSIIESYQQISQALVAGLKLLGVTPENAPQQSVAGQHHGPVCFDAPSHYEITVRGRKLIGSAQLRRASGVLQHGSLPLSGDVAAICGVLQYEDEIQRFQAQQAIRQQAITLADVIDSQRATWRVAAEAVVAGFAAVFDISFSEEPVTAAEMAQAQQVAQMVYGQTDWIARR